MKHTVIAVFDKAEDVRQATEDLSTRGFDASAVHVTHGAEPVDAEVPPAAEIESGPLSGLLHRLSVLFGVDEPHLGHYEEAVRRRGSVVQVDAADEVQAAEARDALLAARAVNIDDRVEEWQRTGWRSTVASTEAVVPARAASGPGVLVHRQEVSIGGVRVYGQATAVAFDDLAHTFRADYETRYAVEGETYDDFDPAYRYGHELAFDRGYDGRSWDDIELLVRAEWERRHPRSAWERFKRAVRYAWEQTARKGER